MLRQLGRHELDNVVHVTVQRTPEVEHLVPTPRRLVDHGRQDL
jgi:hypothetical protein